jgi:hypothetical protein
VSVHGTVVVVLYLYKTLVEIKIKRKKKLTKMSLTFFMGVADVAGLFVGVKVEGGLERGWCRCMISLSYSTCTKNISRNKKKKKEKDLPKCF